MNAKFKSGDIIRSNKNNEKIFYVLNSKYDIYIDTSGRYDEKYEYYNYQCYDLINNKEIIITSHDDYLYDIIMHRFIFEDIKPFMQVLVYDITFNKWIADIISSWGPWDIHTIGHGEFYYKEVVPYNDNTKYLINTSEKQYKYHNFSQIDEVKEYFKNNDLTNINIYKKLSV